MKTDLFDDLATSEGRNRIGSNLNEVSCIIELAESQIPHDELPPIYDWLVERRNELRGASAGLLESRNPCDDKPMAAPGLTSYRYRLPHGFVMIGARNHAEALNEASRSISPRNVERENLQVWTGSEYRPSF